MNLRHPSATTGAAWCNLQTAYEETGCRTCKITLPGVLRVRGASNALRASIKGYVQETIGLIAPLPIRAANSVRFFRLGSTMKKTARAPNWAGFSRGMGAFKLMRMPPFQRTCHERFCVRPPMVSRTMS
jgi:hypothetical protein